MSFCSDVREFFSSYSTVKVLKVKGTSIGVVYRLAQLIIIVYIFGFIVYWKKGYQEFESPRGTSIIKVKGVSKVHLNLPNVHSPWKLPSDYIWDTAEYEIPPIENNAFFIATHQTITPNQFQSACPTSFDERLFCSNTSKTLCVADRPTPSTFGILTGRCISSFENQTIEVCEMNGWCVEESKQSLDYIIDEKDLKSFTVFLKTMVAFSAFDKNLRNIRDNTNFSCRFDGTSSTKDCPIISIDYILSKINTNYSSLLYEGGLIDIRQDWTCNFDLSDDKCVPTYDFVLLQSGDDKQSPGINYRFAQKYFINGTQYRTLTKMYGLRFIVSITGTGGRLNIVHIFLAIGSGISFLAIASIVGDVILVHIHSRRRQYKRDKIDEKSFHSKEDETDILSEP